MILLLSKCHTKVRFKFFIYLFCQVVTLTLVTHHASAGTFSHDTSVVSAPPDSIGGVRPMGLFDLNVGLNVRSSRVSTIANGQESLHHAAGLSGRMQTSVLWSRPVRRAHRFMWGDIIGAELFAGTLTTTFQHQTGKVWVAYKFEFGAGGRFTINENSELGLNIILLKFSKDNVTGNISGSGVAGRYRYKNVMLEAGVEARHERVFGVLTSLQKNIPLQLSFTGRYLLEGGKNAGITLERLGLYNQDEYQYSDTWSLKIFYGIYF